MHATLRVFKHFSNINTYILKYSYLEPNPHTLLRIAVRKHTQSSVAYRSKLATGVDQDFSLIQTLYSTYRTCSTLIQTSISRLFTILLDAYAMCSQTEQPSSKTTE